MQSLHTISTNRWKTPVLISLGCLAGAAAIAGALLAISHSGHAIKSLQGTLGSKIGFAVSFGLTAGIVITAGIIKVKVKQIKDKEEVVPLNRTDVVLKTPEEDYDDNLELNIKGDLTNEDFFRKPLSERITTLHAHLGALGQVNVEHRDVKLLKSYLLQLIKEAEEEVKDAENFKAQNAVLNRRIAGDHNQDASGVHNLLNENRKIPNEYIEQHAEFKCEFLSDVLHLTVNQKTALNRFVRLHNLDHAVLNQDFAFIQALYKELGQPITESQQKAFDEWKLSTNTNHVFPFEIAPKLDVIVITVDDFLEMKDYRNQEGFREISSFEQVTLVHEGEKIFNGKSPMNKLIPKYKQTATNVFQVQVKDNVSIRTYKNERVPLPKTSIIFLQANTKLLGCIKLF